MFWRNGIVVVFIACAIGAAAGWFAERAWGGAACAARTPYQARADVGRAGAPRTPNGRASRPATADAAAEKPNATETELAALRDKAASLDKELKVLLDARARKAKADAQEKDEEDSKNDKPEVSEEEAVYRCKTYGELKRRYPNVWREWHGKFVKNATRELKNYDSWRKYVSEIDVSSMTEDERVNHERMIEVFTKKYALMRDNLEEADKDERTFEQDKENSDEMNRLAQEGRKLMAAERNTLLRMTAENMGRRLGWQEADTAEFAETLRAVGDATSGDTMN